MSKTPKHHAKADCLWSKLLTLTDGRCFMWNEHSMAFRTNTGCKMLDVMLLVGHGVMQLYDANPAVKCLNLILKDLKQQTHHN